MAQWLNSLLETAQDNVPLMAGTLVFLAVATLTVAVASVVQARSDVRRRAADGGHGDFAAGMPSRRSARYGSVQATQRLLGYVTRYFVPADPKQIARLRQQLLQAGFLKPSAVAWFFFARVAVAVGLAGLVAF